MMRPARFKEEAKVQRKKIVSGRNKKPITWSTLSNTWKAIIVVGIIAVGLILTLIFTGVIRFSIAPASTSTTYSIHVWDGALNEELDTDSFYYNLYGTNTSDFADFDLLDNDTGIDISASDMLNPSGTDDTYTMFWVQYNGTQPHDDNIYGADNDLGTRVYAERWARVYPDRANNLVAYQEFGTNDVDIFIFNAGTGNETHTLGSGEISHHTNVTVAIMTNATKTTAMFVPYYDPEIDEIVEAEITCIFNNTAATPIAKGDFKIAGSSGEAPVVLTTAQTSVTFKIGSIMPGTTVLSGIWRVPAIGGGAALELGAMHLLWNGAVLDHIHGS